MTTTLTENEQLLSTINMCVAGAAIGAARVGRNSDSVLRRMKIASIIELFFIKID